VQMRVVDRDHDRRRHGRERSVQCVVLSLLRLEDASVAQSEAIAGRVCQRRGVVPRVCCRRGRSPLDRRRTVVRRARACRRSPRSRSRPPRGSSPTATCPWASRP
jgi:hypothetical protein